MALYKGYRVPFMEGHQGALHRVRFGFLKGAFVGLVHVLVDARTKPATLANDGAIPSPNGDANAAGIADAGLVSDHSGLAKLAKLHGLAVPLPEPEDPVSLGDGVPTFNVGQLAPGLRARGNNGLVKRG